MVLYMLIVEEYDAHSVYLKGHSKEFVYSNVSEVLSISDISWTKVFSYFILF